MYGIAGHMIFFFIELSEFPVLFIASKRVSHLCIFTIINTEDSCLVQDDQVITCLIPQSVGQGTSINVDSTVGSLDVKIKF